MRHLVILFCVGIFALLVATSFAFAGHLFVGLILLLASLVIFGLVILRVALN